jgi:hypothetical protein
MTTEKRHNPKKSNRIAQDKFIAEYFANGGRKKAAADKCEIGWTTVKEWFKEDEEFRERVEEFRDVWCDNLRAVALKRASEKSDTLLIFMLKSLQPETYHDELRIRKWEHDRGLTGGLDNLPVRAVLVREAPPWEKKEEEQSDTEH